MTESDARTTELPEKRRGYSPRETADVRRELVSSMILAQSAVCQKAPERTNLHNLEAVRSVVEVYASACAEVGVVPNMEGVAAALGVSRRRLYQVLDERPDDPVSLFLDRLRTGWASARIALAERGALDPTMVIFTTLNSGLGYSNRHDLIIEPPSSPLPGATDATAARARILAALPDGDGELI